jgi:hypothetical protein
MADRICCFNRHYAEPSGYFEYSHKTSFLKDVNREEEVTYYDSVTGKPLYIAPRGRSFAEFLKESSSHGWPSFRDEEVVWENVRCLKNGEAVSVDGTHVSDTRDCLLIIVSKSTDICSLFTVMLRALCYVLCDMAGVLL